MPETDDLVLPKLHTFFTLLWWYTPHVEEKATFAAFRERYHERSMSFRTLVLAMCAMATSYALRLSTDRERQVDSSLIRAYFNRANEASSLSDCHGGTTIADVVSSHILFMAYTFMGDQQMAWVHLQQALTRAQVLRIDDWKTPDPANPTWRTPRLKLFYTLCNAERLHVFLQRPSDTHPQRLRFTGNPWELTKAFRARLPSSALAHFPEFHARMLSLVDERVLVCWREQCEVASETGCHLWTEQSATTLQEQLGELFDDTICGRLNLFDTRPEGPPGEMHSLVINLGWLRE